MRQLRGLFFHKCPHCGDPISLRTTAQSGSFAILECLSCWTQFRSSRWRRRAIVLALAAAFSYGIFAIATPLNVRSRPLPVFAFVGIEIAAVALFIASRPFEIHRRPHDCRVCGYDVHACEGERCPECGTPLPAHLAKGPREKA